MKRKTITTISITFLIGILIMFFLKVYDFGSYLFSKSEDEKKMAEIYQNADIQNLKFRNLDRINLYISKEENENALILLDSLIANDSSRIDLYLKRGFVNYKVKRTPKAKTDFKYVIDKTTLSIGGQTVIKDNKEQHYYALIGLMLAENTIDKSTLKQYNDIKKNSYISASLDTITSKIIFDIDSAITKQIYDWE
jgi:hypothetical protein